MDKTTLSLRKILGILGMILPLSIIISRLITTGSLNWLVSISACHYFPDYILFEGLVFSVGMFLILYQGYDVKDRWLSTLAGSGAILMVLFPGLSTLDTPEILKCHNFLGLSDSITKWLHNIGALVFFGVLIYIILFQFTKKSNNPSPQKLLRNKIYIFCGWGMFASIFVGGAIGFYLWSYALFIGETLALELFGVAWLIKGETFIKDKVT